MKLLEVTDKQAKFLVKLIRKHLIESVDIDSEYTHKKSNTKWRVISIDRTDGLVVLLKQGFENVNTAPSNAKMIIPIKNVLNYFNPL